MTRRKPALRAWFALLLASSGASAIEVPTGSEDFTLEAEPLVQPRIQVDFDGPPGAAAPSGHANIDFFLRRARLLVRGTAYKQFGFAVNVVALRVGERGNLNNVTPILQDLVFRYLPTPDVSLSFYGNGLPVFRADSRLEEGSDDSWQTDWEPTILDSDQLSNLCVAEDAHGGWLPR